MLVSFYPQYSYWEKVLGCSTKRCGNPNFIAFLEETDGEKILEIPRYSLVGLEDELSFCKCTDRKILHGYRMC